MKRKHNAGFSLVEVLVAIALLGVIVVPTCSSLVFSHRMNTKTDEMMQAQLAVSSAVETLMAEGITEGTDYSERFPNVTVETKKDESKPYYTVTVTSESVDGTVSVTISTTIRESEDDGE